MGNRAVAIENLKKAQTKECQERAKKSSDTTRRIKTLILENLKEDLVKSVGTGDKPTYSVFIEKYIKYAMKNPNSRPAQQLAAMAIKEDTLTMLDEAREKEMNRDLDFQRYRLIKDFFQQQRDVILETNHQKRIIACCSRRAGKTDLASGAICYAAIIPDSRIIYINLTFSNAINQIWNNTMKRADECGLSIVKSSKAEGTIEFANGSSLRIVGNPNNSEIDKLRGESHVSLVVIDEFFHQRNLQYAIDEVISPLLADRRDSTILCMGTPPRLAKTFGEKCWNEKGWKKYHWTLANNPYLPNPDEYIADICKNKGISIDSPFIQREFFGKIGVYDVEAMTFRDRTTYSKLPEDMKVSNVAIGVDYGYSDYNSIITLAYDFKTKKSYVVKEDKFNKAGVSDIIAAIQKQYENAKEICKQHNIDIDNIKIYCDTNEEAITHDLMVKYKLPAYNCYKYDKAYAIEMLAEELRTGRMSIPEHGVLDDEMEQILYKRDDSTDSIIPEFDEEIGIHPDATMALLYASRRAFFDMDYEIDYKEEEEAAPRISNYIKDNTGTITGVVDIEPEASGSVGEDIGVIG